MKKAQGISMNVIIVAAIALLVLVILSVIFLTNMAGVAGETRNPCLKAGGTCIAEGNTCPTGTTDATYECGADSGKKCCMITNP